MINLKIEFKVVDKKRTFDKKLVNGTCLIEDKDLINILNENGIDINDVDKSLVEFTISSEKDSLMLKNLTLFNQINIKSFTNTSAEFELLLIEGIKLHLVNVIIDTFKTSNSWVVIAKSEIKKYDFALDEYMDKINCTPGKFQTSDRLEFRRVKIKELVVYKSIKTIIMQDCDIKELVFNSLPQDNNIYENIIINCNTKINNIKLDGDIKKLSIGESSIYKMKFGRNTIVKRIDIQESNINSVYSFNKDKIKEKDSIAWMLLHNSSINDNNDLLFEESGYMINHLYYNNKGVFTKGIGLFLRFTTGYGYKPFRALIFSFFTISIFALFFVISDSLSNCSILEVKDFIVDGISYYMDRWYLSGTAFTTTGFGDVYPDSWVTKVLSIIESILGVSVLSLFITSLIKRYGERR